MLLGAGSLTLAACNDFLDELPDNRTELDTPDKINRLLVSAYPSRSFTPHVRNCIGQLRRHGSEQS